ncbi:MAG: acetate/propionate family kinase [Chlamydiota bacterium]
MVSESDYILTINTGSSSIKFAIYQLSESEELYLRGMLNDIGSRESLFTVEDRSGKAIEQKQMVVSDHKQAFSIITEWLKNSCTNISIEVIGHRVVHGGEFYREPVLVDSSILKDLEKLTVYDPLHMESEINGIRLCQEIFPKAIHIACFDTAFHHTLPKVASTLPLPKHFRESGIRRYGFHGLSYEYIQQKLQTEISEKEGKGRLIIAHLGSGASLAALNHGVSLDTSMAFSSNSGIVMSTRSGDLDPGLVMYLQEVLGYSSTEIHSLLNQQSGLIGISESTGSMKELLERKSKDPLSALAVNIFCYNVKKFIGGYTAILGGLDTLIFTGGIGEKSAPIRLQICEGLEVLGIHLNREANELNKQKISDSESRVVVRVIPTNEELMIARHAGFCRQLTTQKE